VVILDPKPAALEEKALHRMTVPGPEAMEALGECLGRLLRPGDVVSLSGDLGAGKTVFTKGIARGLGSADPVTSPTFTIVHEYRGRCPLFHMDVYRLDDPAELLDLGFDEYAGGEGVVVIEWGDRLKELLPPDYIGITIKRVPGRDEVRQVEFCCDGGRRLGEEMGGKCAFSD
jgi:tRNA threonylcarbamoyladenosine biosynthesis protein TsaE